MNKFVFRVIALCGGLLLGLVAAELALWTLGLPHFYKAHSSPPQFHFIKDRASGEVLYVNSPASSITFEYGSNPRGYFKPGNVVTHTTNSWGFRGAEFGAPKKPGTVRIAFFGDSFTFGEGVHLEDTFGAATVRLLEQRLQPQHVGVEGYNLGVGGYNTAQELFLLKSMAPDLQPDAVVLCYVLNDAEPPLFTTNAKGVPVRRARGEGVPEGLDQGTPPRTWLYKPRIAQLAWQFKASRERSRQTERYYDALYEAQSAGWTKTRAALKEFVTYCRARNVPLVIMIFPTLYKTDSDYPFAGIHNLISHEITDAGGQVLDLLPNIRGMRAEKLWVYPTDQHPNEKAHRIAAEALSARLADLPEFLATVRRKETEGAAGGHR